MASIQTSTYDGRYLKLTVVEESYSIANNTSTVRWTLESIGGNSGYYTIYNCSVLVNGSSVYNSGTTTWNTYKFPAKTGSTTGTVTITHNSDGTASNVSFNLHGRVYYNGDDNKSGSIALTKIPRQANITSAPNFNDEANPTINYSNPAGNSVSTLQACISLTGSADDIKYRDISKTGSSYTFSLTEAERNILRNACTTSNTRTVYFYVRTVIGGNTYHSSVGKTLTIINGAPTFGTSNVSYKDNNSTTTSVTGNDQKLVQNLSKLLVTITSATAKKGASITKYEATINGTTKSITSAGNIDFGTINSGSDLTLTVKVTDSRGNTNSCNKTVTFLPWVTPSGIVTLKRKNNYEDETYLKVQASYSSVDSKNTITIQYQTKKTTDSTYSALTSINNNTQVTISKAKANAWNFKIIVTDKFGSVTYNAVLAKGNFIFFVDTKKLSVGINCFPKNNESLEINGEQYSTKKQIIDTIYPVGSIYLSVNKTNPGTYLGGTWELVGGSHYLMAYDPNNAWFDVPGGVKGTTSGPGDWNTNNTALTVNQIPGHTHGSKSISGRMQSRAMTSGGNIIDSYDGIISYTADGGNTWSAALNYTSGKNLKTDLITVNATHEHSSVGGGQGHNHFHVSPYYVVSVWKRTK